MKILLSIGEILMLPKETSGINSKRNSNFFIPTIYNNFKRRRRRRRRRSPYGLVTLINQSFF
tara:strand:+ start:383 stop:568 length:186 start_codon:yes stop_codon:yes gene_type:complete